MKLIVGLGNAGARFERTRHNVGRLVVAALARKLKGTPWRTWRSHAQICEVPQAGALLATSLGFMNDSGQPTAALAHYFHVPPESVWLVHDELDLPLGTLRVSRAAASAGHRGVENVIATLGSRELWRYRFGIGRPPANQTAEAYVLATLSQEETAVVEQLAETAASQLAHDLEQGPSVATYQLTALAAATSDQQKKPAV